MSSISERLLAALGGSYTIERELTGGGMALVFAGEDHDLGRKVVIKILPPELAATVSAERFRREILTVARLQHPHIVPILKAGEVDGLPYFVMPYVDGESIDVRLRRTRTLGVRETLGIMKDVARALAFAHEHGVVRSEEHTSELQSRENLVCRLLLEKKKFKIHRRDVSGTLRSQ